MASNIKTLSGMMNQAVFGLHTINTINPKKNSQIIQSSITSNTVGKPIPCCTALAIGDLP